ncbi:MAG: prolyl oligopeptidase family serine peptidase, partial [Bryobacterales bacterium]
YDSIYTERYMGLPSEQEIAYRETSPLRAAKDLHGRLLLAHGTADDNVHVQNTMRMVQALIDAGKPYDLLLYPGKTHGIYGTTARVHLFRSIEEYFEKNLK